VATSFVAWAKARLDRPAKQFTRILDRTQAWLLTRRIKAIKLEKKAEAALLECVGWNELAMRDFSDALAETLTEELNRRRVPGAENSHLIALVATGGELFLSHLELSRRLAGLELEAKKIETEQTKATEQK
jgi:hypothetical protein